MGLTASLTVVSLTFVSIKSQCVLILRQSCQREGELMISEYLIVGRRVKP